MNLIIEDGATYLIMFAISLACIYIPYIRKITDWFVTIVHEMGHGLSAMLLGGGIQGIRLHADGSGLTETSHRVGIFYRLVRRIVLFSGYSFPIYLGLALLISCAAGNKAFGTYVLVGLGLVTFVFIRNWFGFVIILTYLAVIASTLLINFKLDKKYLIIFMGMIFLTKGINDLIRASKFAFSNEDEVQSDFQFLAEDSWFPAPFWYITFIVIHTIIIAFVLTNLEINITFV